MIQFIGGMIAGAILMAAVLIGNTFWEMYKLQREGEKDRDGFL